MNGADILLICGISGAATALGWFAARLTNDGQRYVFPEKSPTRTQPEQSGRSVVSHRSDTTAAGAIRAGKDTLHFVTVIKFPSMIRFRRTAGDPTADAVLRDRAESLAQALPDLRIGRTGIDTIECWLPAASEERAVRMLAEALKTISRESSVDSMDHTDNPRAGLLLVQDLPPPQSAFETATSVLDHTKRADKQIVVDHSDGMMGTGTSSVDVVRRLRDALKTGEVSLAYQPKLDVRKQAFSTAEALFRWESDAVRHLTIGELILSAERHGGIRELTLWSLKRAMSDQLTLMDHGIDMTTFVNLSGNLISDSEFTLEAIEIIKSASGKIGIEITETSVIEHSGRALSNLELLSAAGAEIAIDDYGTGLSSLRYLKRIPAQELKIDREFIKDLTSSHRDPMIVRSTIDLAHALGLRVTAEGVDDATKMALLKVMGCDNLQGFHIAKPMPLTALIEFMADQDRHNSLMNPVFSLLPGQASGGKS